MTIGAQIAITTPILWVTTKFSNMKSDSNPKKNLNHRLLILDFTIGKELVPLIVANCHMHDYLCGPDQWQYL